MNLENHKESNPDFFKDSAARGGAYISHKNFKEPFILETDHFDCQLGAVVMQQEGKAMKVVGYYFPKLSKTEENSKTAEKECSAAVWVVSECCRSYLYGRKFTLIMDHEALRWLLNHKTLCGRLAG